MSLRERGQTTQDFAVGISIFLLAITFVFAFLPSVVTPFHSSVGGAETAQADRVADLIVHNTSTGTGNEIDFTGSDYAGEEDLSKHLGLRASSDDDTVFDHVNVSVEYLGNGTVIGATDDWTAGDRYDDQSAASSARIVTVENGGGNCDPACRLVVRVW